MAREILAPSNRPRPLFAFVARFALVAASAAVVAVWWPGAPAHADCTVTSGSDGGIIYSCDGSTPTAPPPTTAAPPPTTAAPPATRPPTTAPARRPTATTVARTTAPPTTAPPETAPPTTAPPETAPPTTATPTTVAVKGASASRDGSDARSSTREGTLQHQSSRETWILVTVAVIALIGSVGVGAVMFSRTRFGWTSALLPPPTPTSRSTDQKSMKSADRSYTPPQLDDTRHAVH